MKGFTTRPELIGTFGVVATTHWLGTATGMATLEKGGNAFDAAVATGFALQVVEPHLNGPGGDLPIMLYSQKLRAPRVICAQGVAPQSATIDAVRALGLDMIPGTGLLPAVVPGAFDGWMLMLRDHGTMTVRDVLEPAIAFARDGYPLVPNVSNTIATVREIFMNEWKSSAEIYLKNGDVPRPGSIFRNPRMAETYARVLKEAEAAGGDRAAQIEAARAAWYKGFVAEAIDAFCRANEVMDSSGKRHRGFLTGADMATWSAHEEAPMTYDYKGVTVCKTALWGQGPVLLQQLALLDGFDIAAMDPLGPDFVHTVVEAAKLAFADREAFYGDPDFVKVPGDILLSDDYNAQRRALIGAEASHELRPGEISGYGSRPVVRLAGSSGAQAAGAGEPTVARYDNDREPVLASGVMNGDTVHLDIIDKDGNMVSATPSGGWLQSSPVIPELGFCLPTRGQMYWLDEGHPAALAPGKRPRTTLSPALALKDGEPYMAFGTPGGDQQDQWQVPLLLRHLHHGMNLQEAIDAPAFQTAHFPASFYPRECQPGSLTVEGRFPKETVDELKRRGHDVTVDDDWALGRLTATRQEKDAEGTRVLRAAANPRFMQGYAAGR